MTQPLEASSLFNLETYQHSQIFEETAYAWEALGRINKYLQTLDCLGSHEGRVSPDAYLIDPESIFIGPDAQVEAGAYIKGPCYIGNGTVVRYGAYVRGNVLTGRNCVIGHSTEVKNSIFLDKAQAAHFAYVGDSVLGNGVNLGAGARLANLRLDNKEVTVLHEGDVLSTGRRKLGAVLGDNVQIGCNTVCNPGTIMGRDASAYPCTNFGGWVPPAAVVCHGARSRVREARPKALV